MSEFKIGDMVRVIDTKVYTDIRNGTKAMVLKVHDDGNDIFLTVRFESGEKHEWFARRFVKVAPYYKKRVVTYE